MPATAAPPHDNSLSPFIIYPLGKHYDWSQTARSALIPGRRLPFPASLQLGRVGWPILTNELYIEAPRVPSGQRQWKSPHSPPTLFSPVTVDWNPCVDIRKRWKKPGGIPKSLLETELPHGASGSAKYNVWSRNNFHCKPLRLHVLPEH